MIELAVGDLVFGGFERLDWKFLLPISIVPACCCCGWVGGWMDETFVFGKPERLDGEFSLSLGVVPACVV